MAIIDNNSPFEFLINRYYKIGKIVFLEIFANKKDRAVFESGRITIGDLNPSIIPTIEVSGIASASNVIGGYINRQCGFLIPKNTIHIDNFFGSDITYVAINAVYVCGNV